MPIIRIFRWVCVAAGFFLPMSDGARAMATNAAARPELRHRTGTLVVRTQPGAHITTRQLAHAFGFGTAISTRMFNGEITGADREKYLSILKENFNYAVHENALKWMATERKAGEISYRDAEAIWSWCHAQGLRMRGHCVFWGVEERVQDWVRQLNPTELRQRMRTRALGLVEHFRGRIDEFDVNNEMLHGDFYAAQLGESIRLDMFAWCKQAHSDAILYVNDFGILNGNLLEAYDRQIETLLAQGIPLGGIGLQGHFGERVDPVKVKKVLDRLARFKLPIKITEFDMRTLDESAKARGLEDLYRICFEHPAVDGILMWGFWAPCHWLSGKRHGLEGYTALWDRDWNPMLAARVYQGLVFKEWWTCFEGRADTHGICEIPVFLGRHQISTSNASIVVEITAPGARQEVALPGDAL